MAQMHVDDPTVDLAQTRRLVLGYALLSGGVGLLPVPVAPDLTIEVLRLKMLRQIAQRRGVDLTDEGARTISGLEQGSLGRMALTTGTVLALRLSWRRITRGMLLLMRLDDLSRTFVLGTAFDHYCLRHHPGGPITADQADALRRAMLATAASAPGRALARALGQGARSGLELASSLPQILRGAPVAEPAPDTSSGEEPSAPGYQGPAAAEAAGPLRARFEALTHAIESAVTDTTDAVLREYCDAFDEAWARQTDRLQIQRVEPTSSAAGSGSTPPPSPNADA